MADEMISLVNRLTQSTTGILVLISGSIAVIVGSGAWMLHQTTKLGLVKKRKTTTDEVGRPIPKELLALILMQAETSQRLTALLESRGVEPDDDDEPTDD